MKKRIEYREKFDTFKGKTLFNRLDSDQQKFLRYLAFHYRLTFQEFRQVVQAARDLIMWRENDLRLWWKEIVDRHKDTDEIGKKQFLKLLNTHLQSLRAQEKVYTENSDFTPSEHHVQPIILKDSDQIVAGMCPVASDKTVCCQLRTIDVVENCVYGCSYCTIQTFYSKHVVIQKNIKEKLDQLKLEKDRFYHFGTGQSSDSLALGNREGILDAHCQFAAEHANVLMEFKTKSDNIGYFLKNTIPPNVVCSWSLNTPVIIKNEEHFTPNLSKRIAAARKVADKQIKVAFHFHPLVWYRGWHKDYPAIADLLMNEFDPTEVLFISFGSVTLIKPVVRKIRYLGNPTKTLQMQLVEDPHGKLTYPDETKIRMFRKMYDTFKPWHDKVYFYLCMEKAEIWRHSLGYVYDDNEEFEQALGEHSMAKIRREIRID